MKEMIFTNEVTRCGDGVYRWYYDLDMYRNHTLLFKVMKIFGIVMAAVVGIILFLLAGEHLLTWNVILWCAVGMAGAMALMLGSYYLWALCMKGVCRMQYEMDEESITMYQSPRATKTVDAMAGVLVVAGMLTGHAGEGLFRGAMIAGANREKARTALRRVRGMKDDRDHDEIRLRCLPAGTTVWVRPEDYAMVWNFLQEHSGK